MQLLAKQCTLGAWMESKMVSKFEANIREAYRALEERLGEDREWALDYFERRPRKIPRTGLDDTLFIRPPGDHGPIVERRDLNGRVALPLSEGYLAKFFPESQLDSVLFILSPGNVLDNSFEEENVRVLKEHGFIEEDGFYVPEHKVVHVDLEEDDARINDRLYGWVITEDLSEGGSCQVTDVLPHYFVSLDNRAEFFERYEANLRKLREVYDSPNLSPSVYRHASPKDPNLALSKMLLAKVKDNKGEIIVGDLNNVCFDRK